MKQETSNGVGPSVRLVEYQNQLEIAQTAYQDAVGERDGERARILKQTITRINDAIERLMRPSNDSNIA